MGPGSGLQPPSSWSLSRSVGQGSQRKMPAVSAPRDRPADLRVLKHTCDSASAPPSCTSPQAVLPTRRCAQGPGKTHSLLTSPLTPLQTQQQPRDPAPTHHDCESRGNAISPNPQENVLARQSQSVKTGRGVCSFKCAPSKCSDKNRHM